MSDANGGRCYEPDMSLEGGDIFVEEVFEFFLGQKGVNHFKDHLFFFRFQLLNKLYLFREGFIFDGDLVGQLSVKVDQFVQRHAEVAGYFIGRFNG